MSGCKKKMFTIPPRNPGENNKDYSYRVIRDAIMFLELKPGQVISEIDLAQKLEISRTPIREVLGKLREENLVEVIPQVGTYVSKIDIQLIEEAAFMRFVMEKEIAKLACESFPKESLQELKNNLAIQELMVGQDGRERDFHRLDTQFHGIIFKGVRKENIWFSITRLSTHYNRIRVLSELENSFAQAVEEHREMVDCLEQGNAEHVDNILRRHIIEPMRLWDRLITPDSPFSEYFNNRGELYKNLSTIGNFYDLS